jgi:hypothetical protein
MPITRGLMAVGGCLLVHKYPVVFFLVIPMVIPTVIPMVIPMVIPAVIPIYN